MENEKVIDAELNVKGVLIPPTLEKGNYIIEIKSNGEVIKKMAVANSEINIQKLADGGLTVDLK